MIISLFYEYAQYAEYDTSYADANITTTVVHMQLINIISSATFYCLLSDERISCRYITNVE